MRLPRKVRQAHWCREPGGGDCGFGERILQTGNRRVFAAYVRVSPRGSVFLADGLSVVQNTAVGGDGDHIPRDELAAGLQCLFHGIFDTAAAGYLHPHHGDAADMVLFEDLSEFFRIVHRIQLRAAHQRDVPPDEILMEIGIGVSGAVGSHQQFCPVKPGRVYGSQLDLHGPLAELRLLGPLDGVGLRLTADGLGGSARAAAGQGA